MIARIGRKIIIIQEAPTHWDVRYALEDINQIILKKKDKYNPQYFFEGTPAIGQGGFTVIIKLSQEMPDEERRIIKRLLANRGIKVIMEE